MKCTQDQLKTALKNSWHKAVNQNSRFSSGVFLLMNSLLNERFNFVKEPWHSQNGKIAEEILLRAWDGTGTPVNHGGALSDLAEEKGFKELNSFLVYEALHKIDPQPHTPLSINVLPSSLESPEFWTGLDDAMRAHRPENIIFEILEHETDYSVDHGLMTAAMDKGYRFALDDFSATPEDCKRLHDFSPYLSFIKLDGPLVRRGLEDSKLLEKTVSMLKHTYDDVKIIAEYVSSGAEACVLYDMGVSAVQGMSLPRNFKLNFRP